VIDTRSTFYYGYRIESQPQNGFLNIDEGAGEVTFEIPVGTYTLSTLVESLRNTLLTQGTLDYSVSVDRQTRRVTISATTNFDLLTNTGTNVGSSAWTLLGFDISADKTGSNTYTSDFASGDSYSPQFFLQSYVDPEDFQGKQQASKNVAADGTTVEVVNFGIAKFIEMDIKFITSRADIADGINIVHNPTGVEDARRFLKDITELSEFEFLPDATDAGTFFRCILESTPDFPDGTGYKLKELFNRNLRDVYETGVLKMRVID
jgi:hypothetical protein